ncbi:MAG: hypothetical protein AAGF81_22775 [Pseudomonadota bacterium]
MSWYTKNQAVVRSSSIGLLVLAGAVTVDFPNAPADIIPQQPTVVQATKVSLLDLRASLRDPAETLKTGEAYFDLDEQAN